MQKLISLFTRISVVALALVALGLAVASAAAQSNAAELGSLAVELWPDYDRPAMLVLLTGTLPEGTPLPATLVIPVPPQAEIHAAASFNAAGALMSDVSYTIEGELMTLSTPSRQFRVEYYAPYEAAGGRHNYTFNWQAGLSVDEMTVVVQQPLAATDFTVVPAPVSSVAERGDGLTYHTLPSRAVGAGELFAVSVSYAMDAPVLSAPEQSLPVATLPTAAAQTPAGSGSSSGFNPLWLLAIAGALALIGGAWYLGQQRGQAAARARKPQPVRPEKAKPAKKAAGKAQQYCHQCGTAAQPGDTFCRNCGTKLKGN